MSDTLLWVAPAAPFLGFLVNGMFGHRLSAPAVGVVAVLGPLAAFMIAILAFFGVHEGVGLAHVFWQWIATGDLNIGFGLQADALSATMLLNVTGIGSAIHVYSYGYMHEDPSFSRFMAYLNLFLCAMILLVMGDNLILLFVGWEGVGLCSYLLIGFWYDDFANVDAGRKAFIVNRVGDFMFLIGAFTLYALTGALDWTGLELAISGLDTSKVLMDGPLAGWTTGEALTFAALCLFGGATGKSAQIPLYVWLPDAMAGPTPVSALIHAATMVTAGVYLIGRMDFLFALTPGASEVVAVVAALTALMSGTIAMAQYDIKKVLAYSTVSQLGFMFVGMATTVWDTGIFHVLTHAFFKALLFLGAGAVIHAMHHEQDIRKMGGLWHDLKGIAVLFLIGSLALAGIPPFAGFWSKDEILGNVLALSHGEGGVWTAVYWTLTLTAGMTAFYTARLFAITFFGKPADHHRHLHHVHWTMTSVLVFLAILSTVGGLALGGKLEAVGIGGLEHFTHPLWVQAPLFHHLDHDAVHHAHLQAMAVSTVVASVGFLGGLFVYTRARESVRAFVEGPGAALHTVVSNKFYVDELYEAVIVKPAVALAHALWAGVDRAIIDQGLVLGAGRTVAGAAAAAQRTQRGAVNVATASTLIGAVAVLVWMVAHG